MVLNNEKMNQIMMGVIVPVLLDVYNIKKRGM